MALLWWVALLFRPSSCHWQKLRQALRHRLMEWWRQLRSGGCSPEQQQQPEVPPEELVESPSTQEAQSFPWWEQQRLADLLFSSLQPKHQRP